jgi:hypothetical protein
VEQAMTHEVHAGQFAARNAHTLTESELDAVSGGWDYIDSCTAVVGQERAENTWNYLLGQYGY